MSVMRMKLLDWEATGFEQDLEEVIVPIHEAAVTRLQETHYEGQHAAKAKEGAAVDDGEWQLAVDMSNEEEKRAKEREQVVGWLALIHLTIALELKLRKLLDILERISQGQCRGEGLLNRSSKIRGARTWVGGKTWLRYLAGEYERYGIQLASRASFNLLDELAFACNAVKHNSGRVGERYLKAFPTPRFASDRKADDLVSHPNSEDATVVFSNQAFKAAVESLKDFVEWTVREIKYRLDGKRHIGPLQKPRPKLPG